jgi:GTP-binding protein
MAERGEPGEERWLLLELRLIADIGIVGVPNAGKSTLLAAWTRARPKIGDYPFTTLQPNLGVARLDDETDLVLADIPGLIEGAHSGAGLGTAFLRHIQRTRALVHLIDGAAEDPLADYSQVNAEMALFDPGLGERRQIVAINKMDLPEVAARWEELDRLFRQAGVTPMPVSALEKTGLDELLRAAARELEAARRQQQAAPPAPVPTYAASASPLDFAISRDAEGGWRVRGKAIERAAAMTYWEFEEPVRRFQHLLERLGVDQGLRDAGVRPGDTVHIGEHELEWSD